LSCPRAVERVAEEPATSTIELLRANIGPVARAKGEPPQPGNPHELTRRQHVHSATCIARFADKSGRVWVRRKQGPAAFPANQNNPVFCADRAWDERTEKGLFRKIELAFNKEANNIVRTRRVVSHRAISEYVAIWQIRADLSSAPGPDLQLAGIEGTDLTKEQEETLESKHGAFVRAGGVPSRFSAGLSALIQFDKAMSILGTVTWGVIRTKSKVFICPDTPGHSTSFPLTPSISLVAKSPDAVVCDDGVDTLNLAAWDRSHEFVFGTAAGLQFLAQALEHR
jgi:hypothetical protein